MPSIVSPGVIGRDRRARSHHRSRCRPISPNIPTSTRWTTAIELVAPQAARAAWRLARHRRDRPASACRRRGRRDCDASTTEGLILRVEVEDTMIVQLADRHARHRHQRRGSRPRCSSLCAAGCEKLMITSAPAVPPALRQYRRHHHRRAVHHAGAQPSSLDLGHRPSWRSAPSTRSSPRSTSRSCPSPRSASATSRSGRTGGCSPASPLPTASSASAGRRPTWSSWCGGRPSRS